MKTRDRMEDVGRKIDQGSAGRGTSTSLIRDSLEDTGRTNTSSGRLSITSTGYTDGKTLLYDYITEEELWACTTCNACVQECPVNISPLGIIVDLRRAMVMEDSKVPAELAQMNSNIENNGAPWQFSQLDRLNWAEGIEIQTMAQFASRNESPDILFWVGCSGSFDDRIDQHRSLDN